MYNIQDVFCGRSSMVERQPSKLVTWVRFPSPAFQPDVIGKTIYALSCTALNAGVAQLVEHLHGKEKVVGSIPIPSLFLKD